MIHRFNTEIAKEFGVASAVVAQHIWYWVRENEKVNKNCFSGKWWMYSSIREMCEQFYYLTPNQVRKAIEKMENAKFIFKGNFNKTAYDRTCWYTFTDEGYAFYVKAEMDSLNYTKQNC